MEDTANRFDILKQKIEQLAAQAPTETDQANSTTTVDPRHERMRRLSIPPLFWAAALDDFKSRDFSHPENFDRLKRLNEIPGSILIVGENGSGKSHLAAAVAYRWGFRWRSVTLLLTEIRSTFNHYSGASEYAIVKELIDLDLLVLDDISACALNTFALVTLVAVLNARIEHMRPTIVTSAVGYARLEELDTNLSSRLASYARLVLTCGDRRINKEGVIEKCKRVPN